MTLEENLHPSQFHLKTWNMRSKELVGQMSLQNHLLGDYTLHMPRSPTRKKHSIEFETRFEIETRIIIIKVPLIHPMQKLSGNTQNHQCHTHKVGRQAGRKVL